MLEDQRLFHNARLQEAQILESKTLWSRVIQQTDHALDCGALQPIPTTYEWVEQNGVQFLVRMTDLTRKELDKKQQDKVSAVSGKAVSPFLPYDENLFVANLSDTHVCLLNKFNAVDYHLLMVTRAFEEQETLLTLRDFEAMWVCLNEIDGLVFYNGGQIGGASQRHKHLQLIPLPMMPGETTAIPMEPALASVDVRDAIATIPLFTFQHAFIRFAADMPESPSEAAQKTFELYQALLHAVGLSGTGENQVWQSGPYNLLATREWMLMVPRSQEQFESIPVNSLGFAGALLVRDEQQMELLKDCGPFAVLQGVAVPLVDSYSKEN